MRAITQTLNLPFPSKRHFSDLLFIFWAGSTALISYSLVYALRKPFTAAEFEGLYFAGMDYKIAVSIIQLLGYILAKFLGIKFISELQPQNRLKFIIGSAALSEISLLVFGLAPMPYNIFALFFNGLFYMKCVMALCKKDYPLFTILSLMPLKVALRYLPR